MPVLRAVLWDPEVTARRTLVSVLKLAGYETVEQPASPQEALELTSRVQPTVLVFAVPNDGGRWATALADLRASARNTQLVALADADDVHADAAATGVPVVDRRQPRFLDELSRLLATSAAGAAGSSDEQWLPLREAAHAVGVSLGRLRRWCDRGTVPYRKEGGRRLVLLDDVRARAAAETGDGATAEAAAAASPPVTEPEPRPAPEPEPPAEPAPPEPEPEREPAPEAEREPAPETAADGFTLRWPQRQDAPRPSRQAYDVIPDDDAGRRGRRRR